MPRLLVLVLGLLLAMAAPAVAQDPAGPTGATGPGEESVEPRQGDDEDEVVDDGTDEVGGDEDEVGDDEVHGDGPGCDAEDGTDADYVYCACRSGADGTDGDYLYCPLASDGIPGGGGATPKTVASRSAAAAAQTLPATLPLTGQDPIVVALIGLAFVLAGAGARLQLRSRG